MTKHSYPIKQIQISTLLALLLLSLTLCSGCTQKPQEPISKTGFYFDTVITLTLYDSQQEELLEDCFALADKYEKMLSATIDSSDVSNINQAKGQPVTVNPETLELLQKGLAYGTLSEGRFDVTIGNLSSLWNFTENDGVIPDDTEIKTAVSTVDYRNVEISGNQVSLRNPESAIDLGGIAKGYIADKMKEYLLEQGVTSGIINLGGNVLVIGVKTDNTPFTIGIQTPFDSEGSSIATVKIKDMTVVSSGVYERYFTIDDKLYHHILDTSTGYPYDNGLLSVSIICRNSVDGDGLSTTCFSLGLEKGMELVESLENTEAIFITSDYEIHTSSGIGETIPFELMMH